MILGMNDKMRKGDEVWFDGDYAFRVKHAYIGETVKNILGHGRHYIKVVRHLRWYERLYANISRH